MRDDLNQRSDAVTGAQAYRRRRDGVSHRATGRAARVTAGIAEDTGRVPFDTADERSRFVNADTRVARVLPDGTLPLRRVLSPDGSVSPRHDPGLSFARIRDIYEGMVRSRLLDERLLKMQRQGRVGFHVGHRGEEASIVAAAAAMREQDWLVPCYREMGAMFMRGAPMGPYLDNMFGNEDDPCHGRQMPDHFHSKRYRTLSVSAPIGTQIPHAVGLAYAARQKGADEVAVVFFGDGATSSNDFHAAMGFAGVWKAPVVFLCRNNQYAISLPSSKQTASRSFADKAIAYGMPGERVDGNDALAVYGAVKESIERAANGDGPTLLELVTYRVGAHSTSDDPSAYRTDEEVQEAEAGDPLHRLRDYMVGRSWDDTQDAALYAAVDEEVRQALAQAEDKPKPAVATLFNDVYERQPWHLREAERRTLSGPRAKDHG